MIDDLEQRLSALNRSDLSPESGQIAEALAADTTQLTEESSTLLPCELQKALSLPPLRQAHRLEENRIYTITYVLLTGVEPTAVEAALVENPWDWWQRGKVAKWSRRNDGGTSFVLSPVHLVPSKVGVDLDPRTAGEESAPWGATIPVARYAARFSADFEGPGRYEILTLAGGSGLRSIWDGVRRLGMKKLMPLSTILSMHLGAEKGTVGFPPFCKGTGFPGLAAALGVQQ